MVVQYWGAVASLAASVLAGGLAGLLWFKASQSVFYRAVSVLLGSTALLNISSGLTAFGAASVLFWLRLHMVTELVHVVTLLYVGAALLRAVESKEAGSARGRARRALVLAAFLGVVIWSDRLAGFSTADASATAVDLGSIGIVFYAFILLWAVAGLAQLEVVLRALEDPVRYQVKFILIGLGGVAGYQIFQASLLLLLPVWRADGGLAEGIVSILCLGMVAFGLGRTRLRAMKAQLYVSPQALLSSVTVIFVGLYLFSVGIVAQWMLWTGWDLGSTLSALALFGGAMGLVVMLASRSVRGNMRLFVSRHFYRSKYDYRSKWVEITEAFQGADSVETILDRFMAILGRTFVASRISIWMFYEADQRFHRVRSINAEIAPEFVPLSDPVIRRLLSDREPVPAEMTQGRSRIAAEGGASTLQEITRGVLYVPIRTGRGLIALVALGGEPGGEKYGADDGDLLRAIASHVGLLLSHAHLNEERTAAAKLEALHRFAAFYVHDLKNLAARFSLVLQNAEVHGDNPAFQQAAMKTVKQSVKKLTELIAKLSMLPSGDEHPELVDVNALIRETIASLNGDLGAPMRQSLSPVARVSAKRDQLQQVVLNLVLNALQAGGEQNEVSISTAERDGKVAIRVTDKGPGISPERLRTLFQPLQTTKKQGMGIGLYQCQQIVQAHGGSLRIESHPGLGTSVCVELPRADRTGAQSPLDR